MDVLKIFKMEEKQLVNDAMRRWGSKDNMLERIHEKLSALNVIFTGDRKYGKLRIQKSQAKLSDLLLTCFKDSTN